MLLCSRPDVFGRQRDRRQSMSDTHLNAPYPRGRGRIMQRRLALRYNLTGRFFNTHFVSLGIQRYTIMYATF